MPRTTLVTDHPTPHLFLLDASPKCSQLSRCRQPAANGTANATLSAVNAVGTDATNAVNAMDASFLDSSCTQAGLAINVAGVFVLNAGFALVVFKYYAHKLKRAEAPAADAEPAKVGGFAAFAAFAAFACGIGVPFTSQPISTVAAVR